ncbi:MAG: hypothetical protein R2744_13285 [Bacteroidales bacterium]
MPTDIALTDDGGYLVSGSSTTDGNTRGLLLRVESYNPMDWM